MSSTYKQEIEKRRPLVKDHTIKIIAVLTQLAWYCGVRRAARSDSIHRTHGEFRAFIRLHGHVIIRCCPMLSVVRRNLRGSSLRTLRNISGIKDISEQELIIISALEPSIYGHPIGCESCFLKPKYGECCTKPY